MSRQFFKEAVAGVRKNKERDYWISKLSGDLVKNHFPYDNKKKVQAGTGARTGKRELLFRFSGELFQALMKLSRENDYMLHMVLAAGLIVLLDRCTGDRDITWGAPIYKQDREGEFINTVLALRNQLQENMTCKELLLQVKNTVVEATENQNYPLKSLVYHLDLPVTESDFPLFDIALLVEPIHDPQYIRHIPLNMIFIFSRAGQHVSGRIEYNAALYREETIKRIIVYYTRVLEQLVPDVNLKLADVELLSKEEKTRLLEEFNAVEKESRALYVGDKTLVDLFEARVEQTPDAIAVEYEDVKLTYRELNGRANRLTRLLRERGAAADTIIGIMEERSQAMVVGIMGILKSGGAYLPIDAELPKNRVQYILNDCRPSILLTGTRALERFSFTDLQIPPPDPSPPVKTARRTPIANLDHLSIPDRSLIDYEKYTHHISLAMVKHCISIQGTRGCPYDCAYCAKLWPKKYIARSAEHIFEEIRLYYDMGIRRFSFIDDIFNLDMRSSRRFFELILDKGLQVQLLFPAGLRGDIMTTDYIDLMVEAGTINISVALETASPRLQKLIRKNLNIDKLRENLEYICDHHPGVILDLFTMHGLPTETEEEAMMTLEFIKGLKWLHFPLINVLKIYPHTDMEKLALASGISREAILKSQDLAWHEFSETLPFDKNFTLKYQADFLEEYFLLRERLLHVLPRQMRVLTESEITRKYNSYLPIDIHSFEDLLQFMGIEKDRLAVKTCVEEDRFEPRDLNRKLQDYFPVKKPAENALKILLLDMSQSFTEDTQLLDELFEAPLGLMYLMTYLHREFGSQINGKIAKSRVDFDSYAGLRTLLEEFKPDVIGIRTLTFYKDFFHKTAALIRQWGFAGPIAAGGPYATNSYETLLEDGNIDLVVLSEGEVTFAEVVRRIRENNGKLPGPEVLKKIPGIVINPRRLAPGCYPSASPVILFSDLMAESKGLSGIPHEDRNPEPIARPGNLAYTIYTSGSQGNPKGVPVEHRSGVNLLLGLDKRIYNRYHHVSGRGLKIALVSPFVFDASVKQVLAALVLGHTLNIVPEDDRLDGFKLIEFYRKHCIDISDGTPTHLRLLLESLSDDAVGIDLKHFLVGGEALPGVLAAACFNRLVPKGKHLEITNLYGPTECSVDAASFEVTPENAGALETIPIGKPMPNHHIYILGTDTNNNYQLMPIGIPGELCIGGLGVSRGYLNNPELTNEKFLRGSRGQFLQKEPPGRRRQKIYKTGDLGRWLSDGTIEFLGRLDHQVKVRGYRIEPGEIENHLLKHKGIEAVAVIAREDHAGDAYLCAYIVPCGGGEFENATSFSGALREYLSETLPDYMIPPYFVKLDGIPFTSRGKVDRKRLPEPEIGTLAEYSAPRGRMEEKLAELWSRILGIEYDRIGINDDFFALGGHSLRATILVSKIHKEFNIKIPLKEIFKTPNIRGISAYIRSGAADRFTSIKPAEEREYYELSSAQKRFYFLQQIDLTSPGYTLLGLVVLEGAVDRKKLQWCFKQLIRRHEGLRTYFIPVDNEPGQRIVSPGEVDFSLQYHEMTEEEVITFVETKFVNAFDLARAPLIRAGVIKVGEQRHYLMLSMHHIISDGTSQGILMREFMALYEGEKLPLLRLQYKDYSYWQNSKEQKNSEKKQEDFWLKEFAGEIPKLDLPTDYPRPAVKSFEGNRVQFIIDKETTVKLKNLVFAADATLYILMLAIYNVFLYKITGQQDIVIGSPLACRRHVDLESVVGMLVNILAMRNYPNTTGTQTFKEFLRDVRRRTLQAFENQDYKFEDLVAKVSREMDQGRNPLFDAFFSVQNIDFPEIQVSDLKMIPTDYYGKVSRFDLGFIVIEEGPELSVMVEYSTCIFKDETMDRFIRYFKIIIGSILEAPAKKIAEIEIIPEKEKKQLLYDFNNTGKPFVEKAIHELVEGWAEQRPDHTAVRSTIELKNIYDQLKPEQVVIELSYEELNQGANRLAGVLRQKGVSVGWPVGVMVQHPLELAVSLLGILKAGGTYVPLEPRNPQDYNRYILEDSRLRVLVTESSLETGIPGVEPRPTLILVDPDDDNRCDSQGGLSNPGIMVNRTDPAYIIYTSGTTGRPKGTLVEHKGIINYTRWRLDIYGYTGEDVTLQPLSCCFDGFGSNFYSALASGGTLFMVPGAKRMDFNYISSVIKENQVTNMSLVPGMYSALLDSANQEDLQSLRFVVLAGEASPVNLVKRSREKVPQVKLLNEYGLTETSVTAAGGAVIRASNPGVMGSPIANTKIFILDRFLNLVPLGAAGEIFIGGPGLARGYLNRPELTAEKFILAHSSWLIADRREK
ncbi:MAG: AMP-binding protein, partial [Candidatus Aminicenantes bacterium]|nr:AMP-binding protein [Candidatus Aminicenantes bacterium]NIM78332.1 AMP-binding protein [Candidatus Aminicenantes bacterium]NIN17566.1 AMP-binding protein [Candidatus Aminicenantes bacterium]NIN41449.1 AMP-binding protein [Candidatus Aminicenantes bacterium]NIN84218.1 AMP-binding protein [Candidatus Aminicenantes bacterium]